MDKEVDKENERGSASVMMVAMMALLVFVFLGVMALVSASGMMRRAQGAADILAVETATKAYASRSFSSFADVCPSHGETKERFGVLLDRCSVNHRGDVTIEVSVNAPVFHRKIRAVAVAGAR